MTRLKVEQDHTWWVYAVSPRDCFEEFCVGVEKWIECGDVLGSDYDTSACRRALFEEAWWAYLQHESSDGYLRCPPVVLYDAAWDAPYFLIKEDNNGTTYLVSRFSLQGMEESGEMFDVSQVRVRPWTPSMSAMDAVRHAVMEAEARRQAAVTAAAKAETLEDAAWAETRASEMAQAQWEAVEATWEEVLLP